jgi:hypothetical protein
MPNPSVTSISPIKSAVDVSTSTHVTIKFSEGSGYYPLNPQTVTEDTAYLVTIDGESKIACTIRTDVPYYIDLEPNEPLSSSQQYKVSLIGGEDGIKDISGRPLVGVFTSYFTTSSSLVAEVPVLFSPAQAATVYYMPVLEWEDTGAIKYQLEISEESDFSLIYKSVETIENEYALSGLAYGIYYWRVKSITESEESVFSSAYYFEYAISDPGTGMPLPGSIPVLVNSNPLDKSLNVISANTPYIELQYSSEVDLSKLNIKVTSKKNSTKR